MTGDRRRVPTAFITDRSRSPPTIVSGHYAPSAPRTAHAGSRDPVSQHYPVGPALTMRSLRFVDVHRGAEHDRSRAARSTICGSTGRCGRGHRPRAVARQGATRFSSDSVLSRCSSSTRMSPPRRRHRAGRTRSTDLCADDLDKLWRLVLGQLGDSGATSTIFLRLRRPRLRRSDFHVAPASIHAVAPIRAPTDRPSY